MDSVAESHLVDEDLGNEAFPENAGFRMSLESTVERDSIFVFVQPLTKLAEISIVDGVINLQETVNGRWRGLLVGILNNTESNAVALVDTDCNECSKTWQFNAAGMCLCQHAQPGHSTLGTIKTDTHFAHTVCLWEFCPH